MKKKNSLRIIVNLLTVATLAGCAAMTASAQTFTDIKVRFVKSDEPEFENKDAQLSFDVEAKRLRVTSDQKPLDVSFDDVQKVVVEVNTHGEKAGFGATFLGVMAGGLLFGDLIATSIDKPFDNDHFVYLDVKGPEGVKPYLLVVGKKSVPGVLKILRSAFGDRVIVANFPEKFEKIEEGKFNPPKVKIKALSTEKQHPLPELKPDKALLVVSCPATMMMRNRREKLGFAMLIYANDKLVGAVGPGNYTFFYLDPGDYLLVSDTPGPSGLRLNAVAGTDYYLTLTPYPKGFRLKSFLTRHSKELVMYEAGGSMWMDWQIRDDKD